MAGALIRIVPRMDIVRDNIGQVMSTTLVPSLCTLQFPTFQIIARVHDKSTTASSVQTASVIVRNLVEDPDDPANEMLGSTIGTATFLISGGTSGPQPPVFVQLEQPIAATVRILLLARQTVQGSRFTFTLSVDGVGQE